MKQTSLFFFLEETDLCTLRDLNATVNAVASVKFLFFNLTELPCCVLGLFL